MSSSHEHLLVKATLQLLAAGVLLAGLSGCSSRKPVVTFVVPAKFSGVVLVQLDRETGDEPGRGGDTTIHCLPDGTAKVAVDVFRGWHVEKVVDSAGSEIPVVMGAEGVSRSGGRFAFPFTQMGSLRALAVGDSRFIELVTGNRNASG